MRRLILFILHNSVLFVFLFLLIVSISLIVRFNRRQNVAFLNSSGTLTGGVLSVTSSAEDYLYLKERNQNLAQANAELKAESQEASTIESKINMLVKENTMLKRQLNRYIRKDSLKERSLLKDFQFDQFVNYQYTPAKVLRNSISRQHNYLTINKGKKDGIESGMGVVSEDGIVGKVVSSSKHFALVMSLLHEENTISAQVAKNKELGTITWDGKNYQHARMLYLPRHVPIAKGDTIETSGYNAIFPEKVVIGVVDSLQLTENDTYYEVNVKLSTNFNNLSYVYVVADYNRDERMKLEEDVAKSE